MGPADVQRLAQQVMKAAPPAGMPTAVVAVDGFGGAGKSTLAQALAAELGECPVLQTDDFASWEQPLSWWPRMLEEVLRPLSRGEPGRYQRWDWELARLAEWRIVLPTEYLVIEGVTSSRKAFRPFLAFSVWVETPAGERLRRGLARDGEQAREQWERWMAAELAWAADEEPQLHVDVVVSGHLERSGPASEAAER